ncbi:hypothetical protein WN943_022494 [Citrus x changshan-huyou]|uniref:Transmembrane protein n=1 Tax=Citrus limon TaxID=2708 RepID=A0A1S8AD84_CITLI|nr:uncharacterized protein LOC102624242 [Citrus sinensis]XP_024036543.1 uncharacterized protein LOC112096824 [Citrus x clementina]
MEILSPTRTLLKPPLKYFHANQSPPTISSPFYPHRPSLPLLRKTPSRPHLRSCLAASPGPAPQSNPPPPDDPIQPTGFSKLQDRIRIFIAVLFWMSLFFWASAFDNRNNGTPNKGSRFRK